MLKVLKIHFKEGDQSLDVPEDLEIVANLYADLSGTVLLVRTNAPVVVPEVVNPPAETTLENT